MTLYPYCAFVFPSLTQFAQFLYQTWTSQGREIQYNEIFLLIVLEGFALESN